jgi:uncharacterized YigZ family protein
VIQLRYILNEPGRNSLNNVTNPNNNFYQSIKKQSVAEFKDRGSRFIAYAFPVSSAEGFKKRLKELKEEHPKAAHHCFAYRLGRDGNNFRSGDDGEPSGTAGKPILGQIDSKRLTDTAVVVVRYFGGTLLGVPGLINAYKTATSFALQTSSLVRKPVLVGYRLQFDYTTLNEVMRIIKRLECVILSQDLQLFCLMEIGIPRSNLELCLLHLKDLKSMELSAI